MSYVAAVKTNGLVRVWERNNKDRRTVVDYDIPYYFYVADPKEESTIKDIYGTSVKKREFDNWQEFKAVKEQYSFMRKKTWESDIPADLKILSNNYVGVKAPTLNITMYDIEVDYDKNIGFSSPVDPYAPINAIAFYHTWLDKYVVLAIPPKQWKGTTNVAKFKQMLNKIEKVNKKFDLKFFDTEYDLLIEILMQIQNSDLLTGWNSERFDDIYVAQRINRVLGPSLLQGMNFNEGPCPEIKYDEDENGTTTARLACRGRIYLDFMLLFKKLDFISRPSYALAAIAEAVLPDLPKLTYEGSLADLYVNDFPLFVRYNIRDTEILSGLEDTLGFLSLGNEVTHRSTCQFAQVLGTIKVTEMAIINFCHERGIIVPDNKEDKITGSIMGAYVLPPKIGFHDMIGSIDLASLYPSVIRSINISPETLIGQFSDCYYDVDELQAESDKKLTLILDNDSGEITKTAKEWMVFFRTNQFSYSGYGTVFDQKVQGIIPAILEHWYNDRKKCKRLMIEAAKLAVELKSTNISESKRQKILSEYYDRIQMANKLALNSTYGALINEFFRFYDLRLGESVTRTGQAILKHQCAEANRLLTGEYDYLGEAVIYGDTDSFFSDTIINYNNGLKDTIENVFNSLPVKRVDGDKEYASPANDDFKVMSYDQNNSTPVLDDALCIYRRKVTKQQWAVEDSAGNITRYTKDHSVMVERAGELIECKPKEILSTDLVVTLVDSPKNYKIVKSPVKSVKQLEDFDDEYVYDVVMKNKDRQWFFGNNILSHNSTYFKTFAKTEEEAVVVADEIGKLVNSSFTEFMVTHFNVTKDNGAIIQSDREIVATSGIFVEKKRYVLNVIDNEGVKCDKLKIMGLELKKTTVPKEISDILAVYVKRLLDREDWESIAADIVQYKRELKQRDFKFLGLPKGINNVEKYTNEYHDPDSEAMIPGHVRAGIVWNEFREFNKDFNSPAIRSGEKIRQYYFKMPMRFLVIDEETMKITKGKDYKFKAIAIPADIETIPDWFIDTFSKEICYDTQLEKLVDGTLKHILWAIGREVPTAKDENMYELIKFSSTGGIAATKTKRKRTPKPKNEVEDIESLIGF